LVALADNEVSFRWRDYRRHNKSRVMTLAAGEFIRFLLHALPDGFHRICHYGFLANRHRAGKFARCRELLSVAAAPGSADDDKEPRRPPDDPVPLCARVVPGAWSSSPLCHELGRQTTAPDTTAHEPRRLARRDC
jgi:hypothetical protein